MLFPNANGILFVQKKIGIRVRVVWLEGLELERIARPLVLTMSLSSYILNDDSGR